MALILHIETATEVCSVCLSDKGKIIRLKETDEEKSHASRTALFIDEILKEQGINANELDAVAISMGPGSYTGLRIGVSLAKGICYATNRPLIAVSSLQSLASQLLTHLNEKQQQVSETDLLVPMIDARRMEVYTAIFNKRLAEMKATEAMILDEHSFADQLAQGKMFFAGNGAFKIKELIAHPNAIVIDQIQMSAAGMIAAAEQKFAEMAFENLAYFEPFYLKDFIATIPKNKIIPGL